MTKTQVEKKLSYQSKISSEFTHRLSELNPHQVVRVLVLLNLKNNVNPLSHSQKFSEQHISTVKNISKLGKLALDDIRKIARDNNGKLLAEHFSLLGILPLEISVPGVYELVELDTVKAIMEDQEIYPLE